jgi:hypothetical protein
VGREGGEVLGMEAGRGRVVGREGREGVGGGSHHLYRTDISFVIFK